MPKTGPGVAFLLTALAVGSFFNTQSTQSTQELRNKRCKACEGGLPPYSLTAAMHQVAELNGWKLVDVDADLTGKGLRIEKYYRMYNFSAAIDFINEIAPIAESERHHPDFSLLNYRDLTITLSTHAIKGLSENDFILAAKIDRLHPRLKPYQNTQEKDHSTLKAAPLPPAPRPPSGFIPHATVATQTTESGLTNTKSMPAFESRICIPSRSPTQLTEAGIHVEPGKPVTCGTLHPETKRRRATVFMLSGFICSGKSTFASDLAEKEKALVFSPDEWILSLFGLDFPVERFMEHGDRVKETMWGVASQALNRGVSVVLDFSFWSRTDRQAWKKRIEGDGWPVELYFLDTSHSLLRSRLTKRNAERKAETDFYINPETFEKWLPLLEPPLDDEFPVRVPPRP